MPDFNALARIDIGRDAVAFRSVAALEQHLLALPGVALHRLGFSRAQQPMLGYEFGTGPQIVTITAGCHADEPVGPMTAQALPGLIAAHAPHLAQAFTFRVMPQMNPDGADLNRGWFSDSPDFATYLSETVRELPGDDIEFGFSEGPEARPECRAAIPFLWHAGPVTAHFSLHGMAWAEGAWFLINAPWRARVDGLMDRLSGLCDAHKLPLMDIERGGEKGFSRIRKGFSTTPSSVAMKEYFHAQGDPDMAAKFLPSSMEMAMQTGDDPLCIVSELPLFLLDVPASLDDPVLYRFRDALTAARADATPESLSRLVAEFKLQTLSIAQQISVQFAMIVLALDYVLEVRGRRSR